MGGDKNIYNNVQSVFFHFNSYLYIVSLLFLHCGLNFMKLFCYWIQSFLIIPMLYEIKTPEF